MVASEKFSILDHLDALEPDGGSETRTEKSCRCPACGADNFKVNVKNGKYYTYGCDCAWTPAGKQKIIDAIAPRTWQKPTRPQQKRQWTYRDFKGKPIIRVHRTDDGNGQRKIWQKSLVSGKKPRELEPQAAPYRFSECRQALAKGAPSVFWVEGEPCADALWKLGIPATTTVRGSNGYHSEIHRSLFPPEQVVICPDQDTQGIKYAEAIATDYPKAQWLYVNPTSYLWGRLPTSGGFDVADWITNKATAETILSAVGPRRSLQLDKGLQTETPEISLADACKRLEALVIEGVAHSDVQLAIFRLAEQTGRQTRELETLYRAIQQERDTAAVSAVDPADFDDLVRATQGTCNIARLLPTLAPQLERYAQAFNQPSVAFTIPLLSVAGSLLNPETNLAIGGGTDYRIPAIFWGGLVAGPGYIKSPMFNLVMKPIYHLQADASNQYDNDKRAYKQAMESGNSEELASPSLKHYYVDNATVEKIQRIVTEQTDKGLAVAVDELSGFFHSFNQYKGGKGSDRDFWKSVADGSAVKIDRTTEETRFATKTSISVTGTIQPEVLKELMGTGDADGFWSRFLWVQLPLRRLPAPDDGPKIDLTSWLHSTYQRLEQVPAKSFRLSAEARATWRRWHEWIEDKRLGTEIPVERVLYPKYRDRAGRVALIAHCLEAASQGVEVSEEISNETLEAAIAFTTFCLNQTRLLYADMGLSSELTGHLLRTWQFIKEKGLSEITPSDLQRSKRIKVGPRDYAKTPQCRELLEQLTQLGYLTKSDNTFYLAERLSTVETMIENVSTPPKPDMPSNRGLSIEKLKETTATSSAVISNSDSVVVDPSTVENPTEDISTDSKPYISVNREQSVEKLKETPANVLTVDSAVGVGNGVKHPSTALNSQVAANAPPSVETVNDSYRDIEELAIAAFELGDDTGIYDFLDLLNGLDPPVKQEFWEVLDTHNPTLKTRLRDACEHSGREVWQA